MGLLDPEYDLWTGKKIKHKKNNKNQSKKSDNNQSFFGGITPNYDMFKIPNVLSGMSSSGSDTKKENRDEKRSLTTREKKILFAAAKPPFSCQNPYCKNYKKRVDDPEAGHAIAWSRGGPTTLKNSICLCHACNRMQGTKTWKEFMQEQKDARVHNG